MKKYRVVYVKAQDDKTVVLGIQMLREEWEALGKPTINDIITADKLSVRKGNEKI